MRNPTHTLRLAPIALAAVLASATPAVAQDTVTAAPAAAPGTTPVIVLPTLPDPAPSAAAAPAPSMAAAVAPTRTTPARPTAIRTAAPARTPAPAPTVHSAASAAAPLAAAPVIADPLPRVQPAPVEPVAVAAAPAAVTATPVDSSGNGLALAGLAGILALGGIGIAASRRRSRTAVADEAYEDTTTETLAADEPVAVAPTAPEPIAAAPIAAGAGTLALSQVPDAPEGRAELLDRMTNAQPDAANPFHTPKARRRRARLILQGMIARQEQRGEPARSEGRSGPSYDWNSLRPASVPARAYVDA